MSKMKFSFPQDDTTVITGKIMEQLGGRELGKMVQFMPTDSGLVVEIDKFGKSRLEFDRSEDGGNSIFELTKEKIALAHRAFKDEVSGKLRTVIEKAGGTIIWD